MPGTSTPWNRSGAISEAAPPTAALAPCNEEETVVIRNCGAKMCQDAIAPDESGGWPVLA